MANIDDLIGAINGLAAKQGADESASDAYATKNALTLANISYGDITIGQAIAEIGRWAKRENEAVKEGQK